MANLDESIMVEYYRKSCPPLVEGSFWADRHDTWCGTINK
jgi:hypothetical protein